MTTLSALLRPLSRFALAAGLAGAVGFVGPVAVSHAQAPEGAAEAGAHDRHGPGMRRHARARGFLRHMAQELQLSEAQQTQIRSILQEARQNRGERGPGARGEIRERIQAVLTPAQRQQAQELRQQHERRFLERRVARMSERLSLTETQQQQVTGILRNAAMQRRALAESAGDDRASTREAMQALRERTQASIRSVLTPEQATQLEALRAERGERRGHHGRRGHGRGGPRGAAPSGN